MCVLFFIHRAELKNAEPDIDAKLFLRHSASAVAQQFFFFQGHRSRIDAEKQNLYFKRWVPCKDRSLFLHGALPINFFSVPRPCLLVGHSGTFAAQLCVFMLHTQHAKEVKQQYLRDPMISCLAWPCRVSLPQISRRHGG